MCQPAWRRIVSRGNSTGLCRHADLYVQGLKYRLEVFKTPRCGWAVRTWDMIPAGVCVVVFVGEIWPSQDLYAKHLAAERDDMYFFDMGKRTDYDDDNNHIGYQG